VKPSSERRGSRALEILVAEALTALRLRCCRSSGGFLTDVARVCVRRARGMSQLVLP
jgi:hypothetical protein